MPHISRRKFLKVSAGAAIMLGSTPIIAGCKGTANIMNPYTGNSTVAIISGTDLDGMTRDAIDGVGGIKSIVKPGEIVFIKPNFVTFPWARTNNCFHNGECTKPEIIIAVLEECLKAGAKEVIIGEGSHIPTFDWNYAITLDGETTLVQEAERLSTIYPGKVTFACLEVDSQTWVEVPSQTYLGKIAISGLVAGADRVISIPVAKTHSWAELTLGLKNFVGITPLERYAAFVNNSHWDRGKVFDHTSPQAIAQIYLDIVKGIKPDLTIVDMSIGIEGDGPTLGSGGMTIDLKDKIGSWLIVASTDIMAADATAARIMSYQSDNVKQLGMGYNMGIGQINSESIEIIGEKVDNVRVKWTPAELKTRPQVN